RRGLVEIGDVDGSRPAGVHDGHLGAGSRQEVGEHAADRASAADHDAAAQSHRSSPAGTGSLAVAATAATMARDLTTISSNSSSGLDSATIAPPTPKVPRSSAATRVRMT